MTFAPGQRDTADAPLFTFAVIADTHINPDDDWSSSPWQTNRLANARARAVVTQLNALNPNFVVHLGDMVHPVPSRPNYDLAVKRFRSIFSELGPPLHVVPGNHDVGDKPTIWMPAPPIGAQSLALYRQHFGKDYFSFDHRGCRFVVMNSELLNSDLADESAQWTWLAEQFATDLRIFVFKHYPPYLYTADEDEHYDNIAEPARSRFAALLLNHSAEALFCGHVHNYFYNRIGTTDCYVLPATSAVRHDYAELFPVAPTDEEYGRDMRAKLGFFLVDVFANGHAAYWIRTNGETEPARAVAALERPLIHTRGPVAAPIGVDLRHNWADPFSIPHTSAVDEIGRKRVRNDYGLAALQEMGIRRLRVPMQDLVSVDVGQRVADLGALGYRFTVFCFGLPNRQQQAALARCAGLLDSFEIIERAGELPALARSAANLRLQYGVPVFLSRLRVSTDESKEESRQRFAHFIQHGFFASDVASTSGLVGAEAADGLVFRVERDEAVWPSLNAIAKAIHPKSVRATAHVRLAAKNPAKFIADDADTACRVADTVLAAWKQGEQLLVFLDTFDDHDRGYFPRHGLVNRACDPRPAAHVLRRLVETLHSMDPHGYEIIAKDAARLLCSGKSVQVLTLGDCSTVDLGPGVSAGTYQGIRLDTGQRVTGATLKSNVGTTFRLEHQVAGMPALLRII